MSTQRQRVREVYLFVGRIEQALENVSASSNIGEYERMLQPLSEKIERLRKALDPVAQRRRLDAAIESVSKRIGDYARSLKLEHATENVQLNVRELTLQFRQLSGRKDFLWEVGSGQNWVGYHIAGLLALHEHFSNLVQNPVPRFIIIDQPSQVYFPDAWPSLDALPKGEEAIVRSADIEGVHRIFEALCSFLDTLKGQFQVIVSEHAGSITWQGLPHVNVVGNWRDGQDDFLIPAAWTEVTEENQ
jgi:hypothetical protein